MEPHEIQGSLEWLEFRKNKIGSSEAAIVMGLSPWCDAYTLWRRKLGLLPDEQENAAMKRGKELEPIAREEFFKLTGIAMTPVVKVHPEHSFMIASLDGMNIPDGDRIVEIKCGGEALHKLVFDDKIPDFYLAQVQHQLAVTGLNYAYFMSYFNGHSVIKTVDRDEAFIAKLIEAEKDFFRRLREFDPPQAKHMAVDTAEMREAVDRYRLAADMVTRAEEMRDQARNELLLLSKGECIEGFGLKVTHYAQKGTIDYGKIPELEGVDLDKYRKPPSIRTRIS